MSNTQRYRASGFTMREGFSLIELMIAIAILAIIVFVVAPGIFDYLKSAKISATEVTIKTLEGNIKLYQTHVGKYPEKLMDLVRPPSDEKAKKKWRGPYTEEEKLDDAFGNRFEYKLTPSGSKVPYFLYSYGPEGRGSPEAEWIGVWK